MIYGTFSEITNRKEPVLIDFFATWCQPCTALAPVLKEAKAVLGDTAHILKIDIDKNQDLAAKYQIKSVPFAALQRRQAALAAFRNNHKRCAYFRYQFS
jgi:thioredoxin 1